MTIYREAIIVLGLLAVGTPLGDLTGDQRTSFALALLQFPGAAENLPHTELRELFERADREAVPA